MLEVDGTWRGLGGDVIGEQRGGSCKKNLIGGYRELQTTGLPLEGSYERQQSLGFNAPVKVIMKQTVSVFKDIKDPYKIFSVINTASNL